MKKAITVIILLLISFSGIAQENKKYTVNFSSGSSAIDKSSVKILDSVANTVLSLPDYQINITGFTDPLGSDKSNYELGIARANNLRDYLLKKAIPETVMSTFSKGESETNDARLPNEKRRRAEITVWYSGLQQTTPSNYEERTFRGPEGTIVTGTFPKGSEGSLTIAEFATSESMIRNRMFAIDVKGNILQTCGMIEICTSKIDFDPTGNFYTVKMPIRGPANDKMTLWLADQVNSGVRWRNTPIEVTIDAERRYYVFKVPATKDTCITINLDMPCVAANNCEVVFIAAYKPYNFSDVAVKNEQGSLSFSAQVNDTLYAFTKTKGMSMTDMKFFGYRINEPEFSIALEKCIFTREKGSSCYYICEECVKTRKKGFFAWLRRVFTGEIQYEE